MPIRDIITAVVMGVVEGLTEFLPISSTGHLIITGELLSFNGEMAKLFDVFIQLGAILAVVWIYRSKLFRLAATMVSDRPARDFLLKIGIAFLPAAGIGFFAHKFIKQYLFGPVTVAGALIAGGVIMLFIESRRHKDKINEMEDITFTIALIVGFAQVLALFPGVSRAGATIMGGLLAGMSRKASTEFSFLLAIPVMFAATLFDLAKNYSLLTLHDTGILAIGFVTAFFSALLAIRWLIKFVSSHDFKLLAYYRIIIGCVVFSVFLK
ncbi:MAG: undecaprenyl-diphosphatase [Elusimicrobia bacterium RIFOXYB2_FULL_48_7]|nr:MAG: undecaprenyl-diphosphatase [Elusimicrobia bacterium RIFOXYB2_FULL_48_7]